jgi:uncharacterized protein (TIGR00297 family)
LLLFAFLISGSLLTKGGGARTARQVVANGGVAALAALAGSWTAFAGAIAAATADTWATETGAHARALPRLITTWRSVPAGTDGGITVLGTLGGCAGAAVIAALSMAVGHAGIAIAVAGVLGMFVDSLLGASVQGSVRWLDNDAVNLATTISGAGFGLLASRLCC